MQGTSRLLRLPISDVLGFLAVLCVAGTTVLSPSASLAKGLDDSSSVIFSHGQTKWGRTGAGGNGTPIVDGNGTPLLLVQSDSSDGATDRFNSLIKELEREIEQIDQGDNLPPDITDNGGGQSTTPPEEHIAPGATPDNYTDDGGFDESIDGAIGTQESDSPSQQSDSAGQGTTTDNTEETEEDSGTVIGGTTEEEAGTATPLDSIGLPAGFIRSPQELATLANSPYHLRDAMRDALEHDPRIEAGIAGVQTAQERVRQAKAALLPDIVTNFSVEETDSQQTTSLQGTQITAGATLSQSVFSFGRNTQAIREAESNVESALQSLRGIRQQVILETIEAYIQVLIGERIYRIRTNHRIDSISLQTTAEQRLAEGLIPVTDLRLVRSLYNQSESELTQANVDRRIARNNLESLTNRGLGKVSRQDFDPIASMVPNNLNSVITQTLETNTNLKAALASVAAAGARAKRSRSELLPEISLQFSSQFSKIEDTNTSTNSVGLNVSSPLYRGGLLRSSRRESLFALEQAEKQADRVRIEAVTAARNAWTQYVLVQDSHSAIVQALSSEQLAIRDLEDQADEGLVAFWQVLDARNRSLSVQTNEATLGQQIDLYNFRLLFAIGVLDDENIDLFWLSSGDDPVEQTP